MREPEDSTGRTRTRTPTQLHAAMGSSGYSWSAEWTYTVPSSISVDNSIVSTELPSTTIIWGTGSIFPAITMYQLDGKEVTISMDLSAQLPTPSNNADPTLSSSPAVASSPPSTSISPSTTPDSVSVQTTTQLASSLTFTTTAWITQSPESVTVFETMTPLPIESAASSQPSSSSPGTIAGIGIGCVAIGAVFAAINADGEPPTRRLKVLQRARNLCLEALSG